MAHLLTWIGCGPASNPFGLQQMNEKTKELLKSAGILGADVWRWTTDGEQVPEPTDCDVGWRGWQMGTTDTGSHS